MMPIRIFLAALWIALAGYTALVIARDGLDLLPIFFGAIHDGHWPGQFNADFMTLLALSGLWTAWRGGFTAASVSLGLVAFFFGGGFLLAYLLWLSYRHKGDYSRILLGVHAR